MNLVPRSFFLDNFFEDFLNFKENNSLKCDIYEKEGNYFIEMDVDGLKKDDLNIDYDSGYLTIAICKSEEKNDEDKNYIRKERVSRKMQRSFYVGVTDMSKIKAELKDGLLKIIIPKKEEQEVKKTIEIE